MMIILLLILVVALAVSVAINRYIALQARRARKEEETTHQMMALTLQVAGNHVIVYDIAEARIHPLNGTMVPRQGISSEEFKCHVHPDDLHVVVDSIHQIVKGDIKSAEFDYRWNFNFTGGEPRWGHLHNFSVGEYKQGLQRPVNIISTLVDESESRQQQQREEELTNKYKLIFEHSIIGLSFYSPDGWLLNANANMRKICNFDNEETDSFFSSVNLFDMAPFNEVLDRHHVTEYWACSLSIVPERNMRVYLEIRIHPLYNAEGELVYISVAARDVTEEREMYLQAKRNDLEIQKANDAIQVYEQELRYMMEACEMQAWRVSLDRDCIEFYSGLSTVVRSFPLEQLPKIFVNQDDDFVRHLSTPAVAFSRPLFYVGKMYPVVTDRKTEQQWVQINSIPEYDEQGRLKGAFGVWRNIMSMMQKQEQLKRETERANDSGHMKSVFLANMTHEIRTPLNAIVGFSDLLQSIDSLDDKREMIRIIHNNCDMLLRLINDILVLTNVDANAMQMTLEEVDFARVFDDICQSLTQRVSEPGVEFIKDNPCESLIVAIDKNRIQQVITNFVTNAVKYTHQGYIRLGYRLEMRDEKGEISNEKGEMRNGNVEMKNAELEGATAQKDQSDGVQDVVGPVDGGRQSLYVYCEDTGAGIPADQQSRVFERFVKLNDYIQGTGLGLSICKAIIEKCGGEIGVDSELGRGSTFWFRIPLKGERLKS